MARRSSSPSLQPPGEEPQPAPALWTDRGWGKLSLLLLTIALFTFSFAPFNQFYLAWAALVPWLLVLSKSRSARTAFAWSWLAGVGFFIANMWWLVYVTGPGMVALMVVLGLYWGVAGAVIVGSGLLRGGRNESNRVRILLSVFLIAAIWVGLEWLRGTWPLGGLAWLYLGHTQSPVLHLCQIADVTGLFGISFWVALINACIALVILNRPRIGRVFPAIAAVAAVLAIVVGYGFFRFSQNTTKPGPTVMVVQPNYPQSNSGEKGAAPPEILDFHVRQTLASMAAHPVVNLVVWSETMMPPINPQSRRLFRDAESADQQITLIARQYQLALLVGGVYYDDWKEQGRNLIPMDRRNSAYFYSPSGQSSARYDKIHLVPFGEFLPFKSAVPPLYRLFLAMSPYSEEYTLTAGAPDALTVFELKPGWRFVTPICFEDIDGPLVRRMFAPQADNRKRADFIVNITNDGWFKYNEMPQHLQAAIFRSIENRVATARSVNTGISGFIDSLGRTSGLVSAGTEGVSVNTLALDERLTFYTRFGDVFAYICTAVTGLLALGSIGRWWKQRRAIRGTAL